MCWKAKDQVEPTILNQERFKLFVNKYYSRTILQLWRVNLYFDAPTKGPSQKICDIGDSFQLMNTNI